ncbi:MAG: B12-binding domain-containing radical SAM protein [Planctomycetes bacterium]|nr:B12-binding domain-containing radical SAM protein [Planctomycetota bacterium]
MELTMRRGNDVFVPEGGFRDLTGRLATRREELAQIPVVVLSCFDARTRLLPFVIYDHSIFPAGARTVAGAVYQAGFTRTRAVFQLWNKNFRPSRAKIDGLPVQVLLVSSMQIHAGKAYEAIREARNMGAERPLIIAGGPKAVYEPYHFWNRGAGGECAPPDVVVTGEAYVLVELLSVLVQFRGHGETMRMAFERARREGALDGVPGLVYMDPASTLQEPRLVDTGLQRLVQHLDELPDEVTALRLMEPPHKGPGLSARPIADNQVRHHARFVSLLLTQGCKFNCSYCPIPAMNQRSWRFRSPEGIARQLKTVHETFGVRHFFGTDDNFFNRRETAEGIFEALANTKLSNGSPLGRKVRWATEATQFDTFKNRDLLPLARKGGLSGIWFGIEDLTAELVNKGQKPEVTIELFRELQAQRIMPMAMMMYHEGQPFHTRDSLYGLYNQVDFLRKAGAISVQVTVHIPAVGTREYEKTYETGQVLKALGDEHVPESAIDGNHVIVAGREAMWRRQLKLLAAYATFYNPLNLWRAWRHDRSPVRDKRIAFQALGFFAVLWTTWNVLPYLFKLLTRRAAFHAGPVPQSTVPVRQPWQSFSRLPEGCAPDSVTQIEPLQSAA